MLMGTCHNFIPEKLLTVSYSLCQEFNPQPAIPFISYPPQRIEEALHDIHNRAPGLQLLIVILPDVTGSYGKSVQMICNIWCKIYSNNLFMKFFCPQDKSKGSVKQNWGSSLSVANQDKLLNSISSTWKMLP